MTKSTLCHNCHQDIEPLKGYHYSGADEGVYYYKCPNCYHIVYPYKSHRIVRNLFLSLLVLSLLTLFLVNVHAVECNADLSNAAYGVTNCVVSNSLTLNSTKSISLNTTGRVIGFPNSNIVFDCNNSYIYGNFNASTDGIYIGYAAVSNITIQNCKLGGYETDIDTFKNTNITIINVTFISGSKGIFLYKTNNTLISNVNISNTNTSIVVSDISKDTIIQNSWFYNKTGMGLYTGFLHSRAGAINVTFQNNIIQYIDFGIQASSTTNLNFYNNTISKLYNNLDGYGVGILVDGGNDGVNILNNNITYTSGGILIRKTNNFNIQNNILTQDSVTTSYYNRFEPSYAIGVLELFKTWLGDATEAPTDTITKVATYNSSNGVISGNTFNNVNLYLFTQGTNNLTHDLTNYWKRSVRIPNYLVDRSDFYINNNYNNISACNSGVCTIGLGQGYMGTTSLIFLNYSITNQYIYVKNVNNTNSYNITIIRPDMSNQEFNYSLSPNQDITIYTYPSVNAPFTQLVGNVRGDFYGVNSINKFVENGSSIDSNNDGARDMFSNWIWHKSLFEKSGIGYVRMDMNLENKYSNTTINGWNGGVNMTYGNLSVYQNSIKYYAQRGIKVLYIVDYMPTWLALNNTQCSNDRTSCEPYNYTIWNNIVLDWINQTTSGGLYNSTVDIEVWNEPYGGSLLNNLASDHINKSYSYNRIYNSTYNAIKSIYPNMDIGGPAGSHYAPNLMTGFIGNFSNKIDFVSIHPYRTEYFTNSLYNMITEVVGWCNTYNANCKKIILSEWNIENITLTNYTSPDYSSTLNYFSADVSSAYNWMLNSGINLSSILYVWSYDYNYTRNGDFPYYFGLVSEPALSNNILPTYNVTQNFAYRYAPALSSIYNNTISNNTYLKVVSDKIGSTCNLILTNTYSDSMNVSVNYDSSCGTLIDTNTGQLITNGGYVSLDGYDVRYLTTPTTTSGQGVRNYYNYLGEYITSKPLVADQECSGNSTISSLISNNLMPMAIILVVMVLFGATGIFSGGIRDDIDPSIFWIVGFTILGLSIIVGIGILILNSFPC